MYESRQLNFIFLIIKRIIKNSWLIYILLFLLESKNISFEAHEI